MGPRLLGAMPGGTAGSMSIFNSPEHLSLRQ